MKPPYAIGSVPSLSGHAIAYRWRSLPRVRRHRASKPQGSFERVLPWQITMDQLIFASLSHTHYWYEVGMLKVPTCIMYVCMYVCMAIIRSRVWINRVRLLIPLVVSRTEKMNISLSPFAPENLVSQGGCGRRVARQPAHSPHSGWIWCLLTRFLPISAAAFIYLYRLSATGSVPSWSGHTMAYRRRSLPRVRRHRASSHQGSSSNGCCLFRYHHEAINVRLYFPTPTILILVSGGL